MVSAYTNKRAARSLVEDSEYPLTLDDFETIAAIAHAETGIALQSSKATLVYSRLAKRLRSLGLGSFAEYCHLVGSREGLDERQQMLAALTTNVTRFFREPHHFDHLRSKVLAPLADHVRKGGRLRLWSAACSSGQEPYSMALTLLDLMPDASRFDVKILATDIDPNMISAGKTGLYDKASVAAVPNEMRQRWFAASAGAAQKLQIADEVRALVEFRRLNLIGDWPMQGKFQAIFCRNVVIYFDETTQARVWARMVPLLDRDAALYIGHSERISGPAEPALRSDGITTYRPQRLKETLR